MDLAKKLQIPSSASVVVLGLPPDVAFDVPEDCVMTSDPARLAEADAAIAFVTRATEIESVAAGVLAVARSDRLAWIAYPKGRQLGTDLNRDILAALAQEQGVQPVRAVSIDVVWSALRLRPM